MGAAVSAEQTVAAASAELDEYVRWHRRIERRIIRGQIICPACHETKGEHVQGVCLDCQFAAWRDRPGPDCP